MKRSKTGLAAVLADLRADFAAGQESRFQSRLRGVSATGSGADYHYRSERQFLHMMERARSYQRDDPLIGQGIRRLCANIIQEGFVLSPETGDPVIDTALWDRWQDWSCDPDQCHSEGELGFNDFENLALASTVVDGDILALPLKSGSLQWVEAHRLRTPTGTKRNVVHGVLLDSAAKRLEYWITREDLDPLRAVTKVSEIKPYAARDADGHRQVLHLYQPQRFSQRRGVTALSPVSQTIGMHDDLQFTTLVKAQMQAIIAIFRERGEDWQPADGAGATYGPTYQESSQGYTRTIEGIGAGLEIAGERGEKLSAFGSNVPNAEFFQHAMLILTFIAINLDLPVHVLLLDPSKTNFSGWRGAIDQARIRFRQIQKWMIRRLHAPVYRWKVRQWMAADPALARAAEREGIHIFGHKWHPPTWSYIEPEKDVKGDTLQLEGLQNSPRGVLNARGREFETVIDETVADYSYAIREALKAARSINDEFPEAEVGWREIIRLPTATKPAAAPAPPAPEREEIEADAA